MKHFFTIAIMDAAMLSLAFFPVAGLHAAAITFENPVTASNSLVDLIISVLKQIQPFMMMLAALGILWIGFKLVIAVGTGNQADITKWKSLFAYALIGAAIIAGSVVIVEAVRKFAAGIK